MTGYTIDEAAIRAQAAQDGVTHFATGVAAFRDGKLLVVRRVPDDFLGGEWEIPGGGVDTGEAFEIGARREMLEETGLIVDQILTQFEGFDYSTKRKPKVRQINVIVTVHPGEVRLEPTEHDAFKWIDESEINSVIHATKEMSQCLHDAFRAYDQQI